MADAAAVPDISIMSWSVGLEVHFKSMDKMKIFIISCIFTSEKPASERSEERDDMAELTIGEVAARSGIAASAIRYYEREGLLGKAPRKGGRRVYREPVLDELALIDLAKRAGFTVAEIKALRSGVSRRTPPAERWRRLTRSKLVQLDQRIAEAERMKEVLRTITRCRCPGLDDCGRAIRANRPESS